MISHFDTSSVFLVLRDFLICGTVLHKLKKVASIPIKKMRYPLTTNTEIPQKGALLDLEI